MQCEKTRKQALYRANKAGMNARSVAWLKAHPGKQNEYSRKSQRKRRADPAKKAQMQAWQRNHYAGLRQEMLDNYGRRCACPGCPETTERMLTLEHLDGSGADHRRAVGGGGRGGTSQAVLADLKRRGWPKEGYAVLCYNCNCSTYVEKRSGNAYVCPHVTEQAAAFTELRAAVRASWAQEVQF
jgi:hypothetical protein